MTVLGFGRFHRVDRGPVVVKSAGEGVQAGRIVLTNVGDPRGQVLGVARGGFQEPGEAADVVGQPRYLRACLGQLGESLALFGCEPFGAGQEKLAEGLGRDRLPVAVEQARAG
ncbi:hypothetical protein [Nocardiopsis sp. CNT312]|uniref:hypothetical protein n=1 Tax=Nocardiopsis sp. CNT312 TaxID=1137268 RepID=UPI0012DDD984|nr:hypothetical protein [Nocardiopsis sp. CNT312]